MIKSALGLFVLAVLALVIFLPSYTKMQDLRQINDDYKKELIELKEGNSKLKQEERLLRDDPDYLEKVAREKMGLIKEGETIYKITPAPQEENTKKQ